MKLQDAIACVDRGIAQAEKMGLKLSFAVIDEFGQLVQMDRMDAHPLRYFGYRAILSRPVFPGPGALPIMRGKHVVGGYSSNISSNAGGMKIMVDGKKLSRADIVNAYATQTEYLEQHPDVP